MLICQLFSVELEYLCIFYILQDMMRIDEDENILSSGPPKVHHINDSNMV